MKAQEEARRIAEKKRQERIEELRAAKRMKEKTEADKKEDTVKEERNHVESECNKAARDATEEMQVGFVSY